MSLCKSTLTKVSRPLAKTNATLQSRTLRGKRDHNSRDKHADYGTTIPLVAREVVGEPGQPLSPHTRIAMGARYGHDFSDIRVHADAKAASSARTLGAVAYTVGRDVVFGERSYRPWHPGGHAILAHELAHTIQQRTCQGHQVADDSALEREADRATIDVLSGNSTRVQPAPAAPSIQFLSLTGGGFGRALELFTDLWRVQDSTIRLLQSSRTFMGLARTLDRNYVARADSAPFNPDYDANGRISGPAYVPRRMLGKRELDFLRDSPAFIPYESPDNRLSADLIQISRLDRNGFIAEMAHETTHAAHFVGAAAPTPRSLIAEVQAGIQEEIDTRASEARILGEIPHRAVRAEAAHAGSRDPAIVEREITPAIGLTYLELNFFARRLRDAQAADGISDDRAAEIRRTISQAVDVGLAVPDWFGEYGRVWKNRQTAFREWSEFSRRHRQTDADYEEQKEELLQDHSRRFFHGLISYRALPAPAPSSTSTGP